jgi:uncharacterized protein YebE (UPF0316 family)
MQSGFLSGWGLPLLIFLAAMSYLTLDTLRIIFMARGLKLVSSLLGFVEITIFLLAVSQVLLNLDRIENLLAYASGFAVGNYLGMVIEEKLAMGLLIVRILTEGDATDLVRQLGERDLGVTSVGARGIAGRVRIVFSIVRRRDFPELMKLIERHQPKAFVSVQDVRGVRDLKRAAPALRPPFRLLWWKRRRAPA